MKKWLFILSMLILVFPLKADVIDDLQDVAVCVVVPNGHGSGVLKTIKSGNDNISYVWTVAHLIQNTPGVDLAKKIYPEIYITQSRVVDNKIVNKNQSLVDVVLCDPDEDLMLLKIKQKNFSDRSVKFYLEEKNIPLRTQLWGVDNHIGKDSACVFRKGILSNNTTTVEGKSYDLITMPTIRGCSGSGVYTENGKLLGLMAMAKDSTWAFSIPTKRIVVWAKKNKVEWAIQDPKVK